MDDGGAEYWGMEMTLGYPSNISSAGNCEVGIKHPAAAVVKKALGFLDTVFAQSPQAVRRNDSGNDLEYLESVLAAFCSPFHTVAN